MPTIDDLPLETIGRIISIESPIHWTEFARLDARRHFLLDTSLVCRQWTAFAQRALWNSTQLDQSQFERLVAGGGAGRYPMETLEARPNQSWERNSSLESLLESVRGVRRLKIVHGYFDASSLCGSNMRDLKSLELDDTSIVSMAPPDSEDLNDPGYSEWSRGLGLSNELTSEPTLPFNLAHLSLWFPDTSPPNYFDREPFLDHMLIALSRQVSITSLKVGLYNEKGGHLDLLLPLAPRLVEVEFVLHDSDETGWTARALEPFLERCTRLKHFTSNAPTIPSVIHVASPLESWTPSGCKKADLGPILDVLNSKTTGISKLQYLCIPESGMLSALLGIVEDEVETWDGWSELEEVCRKKKIELGVVGQFL